MRVRQSARLLRSTAIGLAAALALGGASVAAQEAEKPNIVIIWGDDMETIRPSTLTSRPMALVSGSNPS